MAEKASWDPAYGGQKIGFDSENRKKLAKLSMTTLTHRSPSYLF